MALVLLDRAQETATAVTTVSFVLLGASTGYQSLADIGNGNTTYYGATDGTNWETGIGTYSTTGPTLTRTTILASSSAGAAVTFSGTVTVFVDYPSGKAVYKDAAGTVTVGPLTANSLNIGTLTYTPANALISSQSSATTYNQIILQNSNTGTSSSADFIVNNDLSTDTTYYGDFGMNSSGFTGSGSFSQPNNVYLSATTADLVIGTTTSNPIRFVVGGGATDAMSISSSGVVVVGPGTAIGGATNPLISANGSANNYVQVYSHNDSNGASASADLIAYPDNGTDASGWVDMGITSSGYADTTYTCTGPNEGYIFMSALSGSGKTGNLVYATDSTGTQNYHKWFVGGFTQATTAWKMQLRPTALDLVIPLNSTVATGTAPFTVASTTQVANLNASTLGGATFDAPGAIGGTTPSTVKTTSLIPSAGTASVAPIVLTAGTNLTTATAGSVEFDTANTIQYFTGNTTNGRGIVPNTNYFRLTANGTATATTISPFFGTNSSIPLVANGVYEIEIEALFLKNTAGTLTWTITNSAVVTNMTATMIMTAVTGMATAGSTIGQGLVTQTAAAAAFAATASLTTAVNHWAKFKIILENASSTSVRLNVTNSAGTVTPLRGSFWKATRITNAGTYAA